MEDISLIKTISGMRIFSPADVVEESKCLKYLADYEVPVYVRLTGTNGNPAVFKAYYEFHPEEPAELRLGSDVLILSTGSIVAECLPPVCSAAEIEGPMYIRLTGEMNQHQVYKEDYDFRISRAVIFCNNAYGWWGLC